MAALKAREVRERCKGRVDPQVMYCLEALAEQQGVIKQELMELAKGFDQVLNIMNTLVTVGEQVRTHSETLNKMRGQGDDDDLPPVTE